MRPVVLLVAIVLAATGVLAGAAAPNVAEEGSLPAAVAVASPEERRQERPSPPSACVGSFGGGPGPTDERDLLVRPLSQFSLEVRSPATGFHLVVALCSGGSAGGRVTVPAGCTGGTMSANVIGVSNGQTVADIRCEGLPPGDYFFAIESGASAFSGAARLYGATFA